jgi:cytosine/creatinine deaminase
MSQDFFDECVQTAIAEARTSLAEGGIPIGAVLAIDGIIAGKGHNRRIQRSSAILHAEMDCLENAGRLTARDYRNATLFTTLSPCDMCSGAILLYRIPNVVILENRNFLGGEDYLRARGVKVQVLNDPTSTQMLKGFIASAPALWSEDIGEVD